MDRGLLLLDVDGPLNPWAAKPHARPDGYVTYRYTRDRQWYSGTDVRRHKGLRVWLNPDHGALLRELARDIGYDLVWATTWMGEANRLVGPAIGLPPLPMIEFGPPEYDPTEGWKPFGGWKWRAVLAYAAGRPVVWWDDEHHVGSAGRAEFEAARGETPTLLCHVNPQVGIQPSHLDAARHWVAQRG